MVFLKKLIQFVGLCCFIFFCFFYTDRVMDVLREEDRIMVELKNIFDVVHMDAVDAVIINDTIIPGINGRTINMDKSYKAMKRAGFFSQDKIVYDVLQPDVSAVYHKDKYLIMGNEKRKIVSIIFLVDDNQYFDKIEKIADSKNVVINYFVNYDYLVSHSTFIKKMNNREFYSYGDNGHYTPDNLLFSNNLISRISDNEANICMCLKKSKDVIDLCYKNDLYTIIPNIIVLNKPYDTVKSYLTNGSMILFYMKQDVVSEFSTIIEYIIGKGFKIVGLSELISE